MTSTFPSQNRSYFLTEAQDLLQTIEQGMFRLRSERTPAGVHELMRAAHTLKGAAASVGMNAINNVAHVLEDIFRAFYNPEIAIDTEIEGLLFQSYECLRLLLTAQFNGNYVDESEVLNRTANIIARLQEKLGDSFDRDAPIPTSAELGFDMVQSMFEIGVTQRLEELREAIAHQSPNLTETLKTQTEIFLGLAESLQLPGFEAIARTTLSALERQPEQVQAIAQAALADFLQGRTLVLEGDRKQGGAPSLALQHLANGTAWVNQPHRVTMTSAWETAASNQSQPTHWGVSPISEPSLRSPTQNISASTQPTQSTALIPLQNSNRSFLSTLTDLLQMRVDLGQWLQQLKNWITLQNTVAETLPQSSTSATVLPSPSSELMPVLALEDLLGNLDTQSLNTINSQAIKETQSNTSNHSWNSSINSCIASDFSSSNLIDPWSGVTADIHTSNHENELIRNHSSIDTKDQKEFFITDSLHHSESKAQTPTLNSQLNSKKITRSHATTAVPTSVRVELDKLEKLNYLTGELLINQNEQVSQEDYLRLVVQELLDRLQKHQQTLNELCSQGDRLLLANHWQQNGKPTQESAPILQQFDELEMDRYSDIHILSRSALHEAVELNSISESLDQTTRQFRRSLEAQQRLLFTVGNDLTAIRMQPLEELFNRLTQVIQQLSASHNKPVEVTVSGTQVLVDKTIVEKLYDPLLHLVRNAFDHGIEHTEIRQANGKLAVGRIEINAYHQGHHTVIEVKDDGPGIHLQRVAQRAVEMGWLPAEAIATTSQSALLSFLFEPGFSTTTQVSDLSGRGVGLDVVRAQAAAFRGSVAINFLPQQGTTFSLQIPLSLTIARLLVCRDQGVAYALPLDAIEQIVSKPDALSWVGQQQVLQWGKGEETTTVAVRSLAELMEFSERDVEANQSRTATTPSIVLLRTATGLLGLQVEQVIGEQELVIRPLGGAIAPPPYIYGCCIVGNSQLALVLDIRTLLQQQSSVAQSQSYNSKTHFNASSAVLSEQSTELSQAKDSELSKNSFSQTDSQSGSDLSPGQPISVLPKSRRPHHFNILLIEDSLTLRQTLSQLLQQVGYQISQAKDGLEGLAFLQKHAGIDLILCDIEMPRMNGFEFLSQRRQHLSLAKIPVVMLTSRSSAKYRQFAMDLGAADFITKPYVDQNLLSTIQNLLVLS